MLDLNTCVPAKGEVASSSGGGEGERGEEADRASDGEQKAVESEEHAKADGAEKKQVRIMESSKKVSCFFILIGDLDYSGSCNW